jgi:hypothetical protein
MHVGDTSSKRKIYLRPLLEWTAILLEKGEIITPTDIFEAYCVFSALVGMYLRREDYFLISTVELIQEYDQFLINYSFRKIEFERREISTSTECVIFGKSFVCSEFL